MTDLTARLEGYAASPALEAKARLAFRHLLFVVILLAVWISTRPFASIADPSTDAPSGDLANQLTFSGLAVLSLFGIGMADRRALRPLLQPSWLLMIGWMGLSVLISTEVGGSFRAAVFTLIAMGLAAALFALPASYCTFRSLLIGSAVAVLALSWLGVFLLPEQAIHSDFDPFEPEHAGSWRGHFDHKNIAGGMMAVLALTGIYAIRSGKRGIGLSLLIGSVVFLYMTRSKTSLALLPVTISLVWLAERTPSLFARIIVLLTPVVALITLTVGSALSPAIREFNMSVLGDPSFTGRYDIWRYGFEKLSEVPWTGFGFEAFWKSSITMYGESKLELAWNVGNIVHGHNAYLDVALTMGIPGLVLAFWCFVIKPVIDFDRAVERPENAALASYSLGIWLFISLAMCLESYYFRRADPVWFALLIAVFALRLSAAYRIDQSSSPAARAS